MSDTPAMTKARATAGDHAGPHGSFPITSQHTVDSAAKLIGHADDPAQVKANVEAIAKRKGFELPAEWQKGKDAQGSLHGGLHKMTQGNGGRDR